MKKRNILRRILAVVLVLTMATGLTAQAKGDASSTSLKEAQKEKAALEKQLKAAKELINDLKDSKGDVEDKVQELNNELVDISSKITSLENQLADKSTEIADAEAELAQAEADKQKQYDDMKTRIRYMYENSQTTYLEQLLESNSVAEFLNTAEYIAEIQKYDRQKLDEYTENIEYITVAKEQLEQDYADLENMKANVESQKQSVAALMSQKETELAGITSNISDAQEDAKYFEAEIQAQNELIAEIKRIEAEKAAAAAKAAAEGKEVADNPYTGGAFTWPCPSSTRVTSDYGTRVSPTSGASSNHNRGLSRCSDRCSGKRYRKGGKLQQCSRKLRDDRSWRRTLYRLYALFLACSFGRNSSFRRSDDRLRWKYRYFYWKSFTFWCIIKRKLCQSVELSQGLISVPGIRQIKYIKRGCHTKAGNQKRHFVYNLFFLFCKGYGK
mgnify:CR=1 FL=1